MLRILIVCDDLDPDIGANALLCYKHFVESVDLKKCKVVLLKGKDCVPAKVEAAITRFKQKPFIFIAYSHGERDKLISYKSPDGYVLAKGNASNAHFFGDTLFYTNSCHTALELKDYLIEYNCFAYIGYEDVVRLPCDEADDLLFIACENKGIIHFLTTSDTLEKAFEVMKQFYEDTYDELAKRDFVLASRLLSAKEALVIAGNQAITRKKFM
jgi:hypothetical protein